MQKPEIIFFGNGPLADFALEILEPACEIIFHVRTPDDLAQIKSIKAQHPAALGILASFGILITSDILHLFEPEGILNIHPSLLPAYRGASPIESAILAGDSSFSVSVIKLVEAMDAGPIYYQTTLHDLPLDKPSIYRALAQAGASWIVENLNKLRTYHDNPPNPIYLFPDYHIQSDSAATYTKKFSKAQSFLTPEVDSADTTLRKIVAYQDFPKPKFIFYNQEVIILSAHIESADSFTPTEETLGFRCADGNFVIIDRLQPASRNPMDVHSFLNGIRTDARINGRNTPLYS